MHAPGRNALLGMVAGPIIWAVHFLVCYVLVSLVCAAGWQSPRVFGLHPAEAGVALASLAALILIGYTAALNMEKYRKAPCDESGAHDMSCFLALNALLLCGLATVALVWVASPAFLLSACAA